MSRFISFEGFRSKLASYIGISESANRVSDATPSSRLSDDLNFDSSALVELQIGLEDAYNISLSDEEVALCKTMADLHALVQKKSN